MFKKSAFLNLFLFESFHDWQSSKNCQLLRAFSELKFFGLWMLFFMPALAQAQFKDPTKPDSALFPPVVSLTKPVPEKLVLSAIWITATGKWATINGMTVKKGDILLNNAKIVKITENTVSLNHNGSIKVLRLLHSPYQTQ
jgi:hypothetical protein